MVIASNDIILQVSKKCTSMTMVHKTITMSLDSTVSHIEEIEIKYAAFINIITMFANLLKHLSSKQK